MDIQPDVRPISAERRADNILCIKFSDGSVRQYPYFPSLEQKKGPKKDVPEHEKYG
jgi:hypothetical protein